MYFTDYIQMRKFMPNKFTYNQLHFKMIDVGGGLNTRSQLQMHFSFTFIQD